MARYGWEFRKPSEALRYRWHEDNASLRRSDVYARGNCFEAAGIRYEPQILFIPRSGRLAIRRVHLAMFLDRQT